MSGLRFLQCSTADAAAAFAGGIEVSLGGITLIPCQLTVTGAHFQDLCQWPEAQGPCLGEATM
jgi:hypothetical protein